MTSITFNAEKWTKGQDIVTFDIYTLVKENNQGALYSWDITEQLVAWYHRKTVEELRYAWGQENNDDPDNEYPIGDYIAYVNSEAKRCNLKLTVSR